MSSSNTKDLLFSIIIPTRNRPVEFKEALDSVLAQSYDRFEIIVVNDGTNEHHRADYDQLEAEYSQVTFLNLIERSRGHGHCFARNQGVDAAKGEYIGFLDDDDYWTDPDFLKRAATEIVKSNADFYMANQKAVTHDGKEIHNVWVENLPEKLATNDSRLASQVFSVNISEMLRANGFPHQNVCLIARSLYDKVGGMDENLRYEPDRDIYIRLLDNASSMLYDKTIVAIHNVPDKSKSANASTKTNRLEKLLFQLRTVEKSILFGQHQEIIEFSKARKGFILKHISEELTKLNKHTQAYWYAKEALNVSFTFKWWLYTHYCLIKKWKN